MGQPSVSSDISYAAVTLVSGGVAVDDACEYTTCTLNVSQEALLEMKVDWFSLIDFDEH
jgi:hypothetical protein